MLRRNVNPVTPLTHYTPYVIVTSTAIFYALYLVINRKFLLESLSPLQFSFGSALFACLFACMFLLASNKLKEIGQINRQSWGLIVAVGLAVEVVSRLLMFYGQSFISATNAGFIYGTLPVFALLIAYLVLKESIRLAQLSIVVLMMFGVFLLTTGGAPAAVQIGDVIVLASSIILGAEKPLSRKILLSGVDPIVLTSLTLAVGTIGLFVIALSRESLDVRHWEFYLTSGLLIFLTIWSKNVALSRIKAGIVSSMLLLIPVFTALIAIFVLDEHMTLAQICGGIFIVTGGYLLSRPVTSRPLDSRSLGQGQERTISKQHHEAVQKNAQVNPINK